MILWALVRGDFRTQLKYGLASLYVFLSSMYVALLFLLPRDIRKIAALIMVFTDPAAMGLYFMGAMVLFEQSQRVISSLGVAPIRAWEYVLSKLLTISLISVCAAVFIAILSEGGFNILPLAAGVFLGSMLFSSLGMILAARAATLNGFLLSTIPAELVLFLPAMAWVFGIQTPALFLHPGVCLVVLLMGGGSQWAAFILLAVWVAVFFSLAVRVAGRMFTRMGGGVA